MKIKWHIFFLLALCITNCGGSPTPEPVIKGLIPTFEVRISNSIWKPYSAGIRVVLNDITGVIHFDLVDDLYGPFNSKARKFSLTISNINYPWLPLSEYKLQELDENFRVYSSLTETNLDRTSTFRFADQNPAVSLEITNIKNEGGITYLDGRFYSAVCNGDYAPNCLAVSGTFKDVRLFESSHDMYQFFALRY